MVDITKKIRNSFLLQCADSDIDVSVSAIEYIYPCENLEADPNVPLPIPEQTVFVTGENESLAVREFYNPQNLKMLNYQLVDWHDCDDSVVLQGNEVFIAEVDCSEPGTLELLKAIANEEEFIFVSIYNIHQATNDTLLWLMNWMQEYDYNFVVILEAAIGGTHSQMLGLTEDF